MTKPEPTHNALKLGNVGNRRHLRVEIGSCDGAILLFIALFYRYIVTLRNTGLKEGPKVRRSIHQDIAISADERHTQLRRSNLLLKPQAVVSLYHVLHHFIRGNNRIGHIPKVDEGRLVAVA